MGRRWPFSRWGDSAANAAPAPNVAPLDAAPANAAPADAAPAEDQARLAFALEGTNDGLWDVQLPSGSGYLSPRGCEILGFRPDELPRIAATWDQLVHPEDLPATQAAVDAYLAGRAPIFEAELRLRTAASEWKWVAARGKAVARDASGAPTRMVGMYTDISARRRDAEALRASEERVRLALDSADLGFFDVNVQTGETIVNAEYARMLGYDPAEFHETDAAWTERIHPDDREAVAAADRDYAAGKLPQYRVEFRQRTRSGDWKWTLLLGRFVEWDARGAPLRMIGTHLDISARKQAEEQLRAAAG
jgi:PAS domain S-box-containing protein